jgi:transcriptional regulator with XRE-family HTH domain
MLFTRPLEYYRQERVLSVAEFAAFLGISEQTYRRLLNEPDQVRMKTKRQVLERLGIPSAYYVRELVPPPTQEEVDRVMATLEEGDRLGCLALDPDTLEPTGEIFDMRGNLLRTYDPKTQEPWP